MDGKGEGIMQMGKQRKLTDIHIIQDISLSLSPLCLFTYLCRAPAMDKSRYDVVRARRTISTWESAAARTSASSSGLIDTYRVRCRMRPRLS